jgi:hypothetical protein
LPPSAYSREALDAISKSDIGTIAAATELTRVHHQRDSARAQDWKTFLRNHTPHIAANDMFVVPTIGFGLLYGLVILRLERRRLVWINVTANPTAEWIARQIIEAFLGMIEADPSACPITLSLSYSTALPSVRQASRYGRSGDRESPFGSAHFQVQAFDWDPIRAEH